MDWFDIVRVGEECGLVSAEIGSGVGVIAFKDGIQLDLWAGRASIYTLDSRGEGAAPSAADTSLLGQHNVGEPATRVVLLLAPRRAACTKASCKDQEGQAVCAQVQNSQE
jgi:hypothetical protein